MITTMNKTGIHLTAFMHQKHGPLLLTGAGRAILLTLVFLSLINY
jgi:hypothetical protein